MARTLICGGRLITPDGILDGHSLLIENGKIAAILTPGAAAPMDAAVVDAAGEYVSPGFVDIHQHGGGGSDYMDADPDAYYHALSAHLAHGATSVMPTLLSAGVENTVRAAKQYVQALQDPRIRTNLLGLHMEGLFISPMQAGAQNPDCIKEFDEKDYTAIYDAAEGHLARWSVAPELPGSEQFARFAANKGFKLSIAHSNADFDTVLRAYDWGFHHVTHLYSGMSTVSRKGGFRIAGVLEAAYYLDDMEVEIIADGCHLPCSLLKLVTKLKKPGTVALITDAMRAAGQNVQESILGSGEDAMPVIIEDGVAKLPSREAFAGSIATADRLVRTMVAAGTPLTETVRMASEYPLRMMGISGKGTLAPGYDADLCVFDEDIQVSAVFVKGQRIKL